LPVDEGDHVNAGDVLCKLRDTQRRLAYNEAEATLAQWKATVEERKADLDKAAFERERLTKLLEVHGCSPKEYSDAVDEHRAAVERLSQAQQVVAAQEAVAGRLADDVERTTIRAPFDGYVVAKRTEVGSWVDQGGQIVDMIDLSVARCRVDVPESVVSFCEVGALATVAIEALGETFEGSISRVIPDADPQARTFPVDVDVPNPDGRLKAGMFIRAAVPSGPAAPRLLVPKDAIVVRGPSRTVFVIREGEQGPMAVPTPVQVVSEILHYVAIDAEGLAPDMQVVVRGNEYLFGPTHVVPMPRDMDAPGAEAPLANVSGDRQPATTSQPVHDG